MGIVEKSTGTDGPKPKVPKGKDNYKSLEEDQRKSIGAYFLQF
jgi:hypothetical protein